jgi:DNA polymerase V
LRIPFYKQGVSAGFPSPAADFMEMSIDLNKQLSENRWLLFILRLKETL